MPADAGLEFGGGGGGLEPPTSTSGRAERCAYESGRLSGARRVMWCGETRSSRYVCSSPWLWSSSPRVQPCRTTAWESGP